MPNSRGRYNTNPNRGNFLFSLWLIITRLLPLPLVLAFGATACSERSSYDISWINESDVALHDVSAQIGRKQPSCGDLMSKGEAGYGLFAFPLPETTSVKWRSSDGNQHSATVQVAKLAPPNFRSGTVEFRIHADNSVSVTFLIFDSPEKPSQEYTPNESSEQLALRKTGNALFEAIASGDTNGILTALAGGVDINRPIDGLRGWTPLGAAASAGRLDVANLLLRRGAKPNNALYFAARDADAGMISLLSKQGADVNFAEPEQDTALIVAISNHRIANARQLLDLGADVNKPGVNQATPIFAAAIQGELEIAELLIQLGANPNTRNVDGITPLSIVGQIVRDTADGPKRQQYEYVMSFLSQSGAKK